MKTAWIFQHVPFEGPGAYAPRLLFRGYTLKTYRWWESSSPPDLSDVDAVMVMGGPMSVNEEAEFPWLRDEKAWMAEALQKELPMVGVCLGAQLMANVLGAVVKPNPEREIGWWPIHAVASPQDDPIHVLHWHGETFDLPEEALHLERSEGCEHQSFQWGERAVGLQYHIETTPESLDALVENCRNELTPGRFVQSEADIRSGWSSYHAQMENRLDGLLNQILGE